MGILRRVFVTKCTLSLKNFHDGIKRLAPKELDTVVIALNSNLAPGDMADKALMKIAILISALYKFYYYHGPVYITNFAKYQWFECKVVFIYTLNIHVTKI